MKRFFYFALILVLIFCAGCGDDETDKNKTQETKVEEPENSAEKLRDEVAATGKIIIAADDFSNLQLAEIDKPVYDKYGVFDRQENNLATTLPDITPYKNEKVVYLTFDDGPDDKVTPQILDVLQQEEVHATFYVLGVMVEKNPEVLKRIFTEGHAIGNHSYNHVYEEIYVSPWAFAEQFIKTDEIIQAVVGVRPLIIRAPGGTAGVFDANYWEMIKALGYVEHDWNASTEDATAQKPDSIAEVNNVVAQLGDNPPQTVILLMHSKDGKEETVKALPDLIHMFKEKGYKFGVVTPMTPQP